jgi:Arc/MetJ-type ribon-helix-helix transcriptional regulator
MAAEAAIPVVTALSRIPGGHTVHETGRHAGSINGVKVSVSLSEEDVEFLDAYAKDQRVGSRSAALRKAVDLLRAAQLADAYEDAWDSWSSSGYSEAWDAALADGLGN